MKANLGKAIAVSVLATLCGPTVGQDVGYINLLVLAGDNLVACPLALVPDNSLDTLYTVLPSGSTFAPWDPVAQAYLPASVYDTQAGWSTNYQLPPAAGGLLHSPSNQVVSVWGTIDLFWTPPQRGPGVSLLSCGAPRPTANFQQVVGRDPQDGEWVRSLDPASQVYTTSTFHGNGWDHGPPVLLPGQSAFFFLSVTLSAALVPPNLVFSWPTNMGSWQLQERTVASGPWADVAASPQEVNGREQVVLGIPPDNRFFRLKNQ
jgi:hypothetical protein